MFCRLNAGILTLCGRQTKVYSLSFWNLSIFCCRIRIKKTIKSNKLFLRNGYLVNHIMCSRTRYVLYFAFKFFVIQFSIHSPFCPGSLTWVKDWVSFLTCQIWVTKINFTVDLLQYSTSFSQHLIIVLSHKWEWRSYWNEKLRLLCKKWNV